MRQNAASHHSSCTLLPRKPRFVPWKRLSFPQRTTASRCRRVVQRRVHPEQPGLRRAAPGERDPGGRPLGVGRVGSARHLGVVVRTAELGGHVRICDRSHGAVRNCDIPNVFTPDDLGGNNSFRIRGLSNLEGTRLVVLNRYGVEVWSDQTTSNAQSELVWNGRYANGDQVPDGHYQWVLVRPDGQRQHGSLHVFRTP